MTVTTRLYTALFGQLVGVDEFGNRYFHRRGRTHGDSSAYDKRKREKRWVMYNGKAEPSKVPPEWHGWLHYTLDKPPTERRIAHYAWEREHLPNLTGTSHAYVPPGHLLRGAIRDPSTSDYEPWKP